MRTLTSGWWYVGCNTASIQKLNIKRLDMIGVIKSNPNNTLITCSTRESDTGVMILTPDEVDLISRDIIVHRPISCPPLGEECTKLVFTSSPRYEDLVLERGNYIIREGYKITVEEPFSGVVNLQYKEPTSFSQFVKQHTSNSHHWNSVMISRWFLDTLLYYRTLVPLGDVPDNCVQPCEPKNNGSRSICFWCKQPTDPMFGTLRICRKCGK